MINQTGTPKTTLLGNTILNITIGSKIPVRGTFFSFDTLFKGAKVVPPGKIKLSLKNYIMGDNSKDITGTLTCIYLYRHVIGGERTYGESDDTVEYHYGRITTPVALISQKDLKPAYYYIYDKKNSVNMEVKDLFDPSLKNIDLDFASYDEAQEFIDWLSQMNLLANSVVTTTSGKKSKKIVTKPLKRYLFNDRYRLTTIKGIVAPGYETINLEVMTTQK